MAVFVEPAWDAPLDGETYLRAVPTQATIKGMFSAAILAEAKVRNVVLATANDRYLPFLEYPLAHHMRLVLEACPVFWPTLSLRQGLRKMGRAAMGALTTTTAGKAVLGGLTTVDTVPLAIRALVRAYSMSFTKPTPTIEVTEEAEGSCVLRISDLWDFLDSHQVGVVEGLCRLCNVRAEVRIWTEGLSSGQFHVRWIPAGPPSAP